MNDQRKSKAIEEALNSLFEFFDTVQILVSKSDASGESLMTNAVGKGNILARIQQARLWIEIQEAEILGSAGDGGEEPPNEPQEENEKR